MTNKTNDQTGLSVKNGEEIKIHMAYTLNNTQPVVCTMVSDEPLFYMCEDLESEEEYILAEEKNSSFNTMELESEMAKLRHKMEAYDKISTHYSKLKDERVQDFITQGAFLTQDVIENSDTIEALESILSQSMFASSLLSQAKSFGIETVLTDTVEKSFFSAASKKILINENLDQTTKVLALIRELRIVSLAQSNAHQSALSFHPDHAVLVNRAQQADLSASIIRAAWELKLKGQTEFWSYIENSSFSDLGRAFAREACVDFRALNSGKAMAAVFETWFLSERCRVQDQRLIQAMLAEQESYIADHIDNADSNMIQFIHNIGQQPYGKNYLASYAHMILEDKVFTDVRDRSNANFLWFIKFERSFNEAEQQLQLSDEQSVPDIKLGLIHHTEDTDYAINSQSSDDARENIIHVSFGAN